MKTINSSIEIFLSLAGILVLTFMTVSVYQILTPKMAGNKSGNVAGLVTKAATLEPDIDLVTSSNKSLFFKSEENNKSYTVYVERLEGSAKSMIFKFRNPNTEERKLKLKASIADELKNFVQIEFIYKNQTLKLNNLTGFSKSITLPANSVLDVDIRVSNLLNTTLDEANFNLSFE